MADPTHFHGANRTFKAPQGSENVGDLDTFVNGHAIVSAWKLRPEELEDVIRTGTVFVSSMSGQVLFPMFIGSEETVRMVVADTGPVWERKPSGLVSSCAVAGCRLEGTTFPVVVFAPAGWDNCIPAPYRLEIPRLVCAQHQPDFRPELYFTEAARATMTGMITAGGRSAPDYSVLDVEWLPADDPVYEELKGGGEARLWFG